MKIESKCTSNPKVQIIEISGDLTGRGAIELHEYLLNRLDEGKLYQMINLKQVRKIDGLGINILHKFISRGMMIRLFNVRTEIRGMIRLSGKDDLIKTYNETDHDKVVSKFEKEILEEKDTVKDGVKRRRHYRMNTFFITEFRYHINHNGVVVCKANVLNLSKGGIFVDLIKANSKKTGERVNKPEIVGKELNDLGFKLNGSSELVETKGICVWWKTGNGQPCAGIRFKEISNESKNRIHEYINESINLEE